MTARLSSETGTSWATIDSPLGPLLLAWNERGLSHVLFPADGDPVAANPSWLPQSEPAFGAAAQLAAYFAGDRRDFDLPLAPEGTPFQLRVWEELSQIPYGHTISYGELARRIGRPTASRAVGAANGRNPLPIVIPCHRVVGSHGQLTGYGGGLPIKEFLLNLESRSSFSLTPG